MSVEVQLLALTLLGGIPSDTPPDVWAQSIQGTWMDQAELDALQPRSGVERPRLPWMAMWRGDETEILETPRWVKHKVTPRQRLGDVAARYGVTAKMLRAWNPGKVQGGGLLKKGKTLKIRATRIPPHLDQIEHVVVQGETWGSIAAAYRVEPRDLKAWNWRAGGLNEGEKLQVWIDPGKPWTVWRETGVEVPDPPEIPVGSLSKGRPQKGRLVDGVMLPESPLYTIRVPEISYGSTHTLRALVDGIHRLRKDAGYTGEIVVGSISRPRGGRFAPHLSHQSGRDVDIRLPRLPGVPPGHSPSPDEIDWAATWALIKSLVDTGEVSYIFLSGELQRNLHHAARSMGATHDELVRLIQWPYEYGEQAPVVRHSSGHDTHIHVRFRCGSDEPKCKRGH